MIKLPMGVVTYMDIDKMFLMARQILSLSIRNYRKFSRTPVRVHYPKEQVTVDEYVQSSKFVGANILPENSPEKPVETKETSASGILNELRSATCTSYSTSKEKMRSLTESVKSKKSREKKDIFILENPCIIQEALSIGIFPEALFFSQYEDAVSVIPQDFKNQDFKNILKKLALYKTPYSSLQSCSSVTTSPGILGVFKLSKVREQLLQKRFKSSLPVSIVADQIRDPGNMGSILRTAAAVGVNNAILIQGCCDIWDTKVLRSASGSHFHLKITEGSTWHSLAEHMDNSLVYVADICKGNEDSKSNINENRIYTAVKQYDNVDFKQKNVQILVIIGSETGVSNEARKFTLQYNGIQLTIPQAKGINSLNAGVAAGIILYEIRRQFTSTT